MHWQAVCIVQSALQNGNLPLRLVINQNFQHKVQKTEIKSLFSGTAQYQRRKIMMVLITISFICGNKMYEDVPIVGHPGNFTILDHGNTSPNTSLRLHQPIKLKRKFENGLNCTDLQCVQSIAGSIYVCTSIVEVKRLCKSVIFYDFYIFYNCR